MKNIIYREKASDVVLFFFFLYYHILKSFTRLKLVLTVNYLHICFYSLRVIKLFGNVLLAKSTQIKILKKKS